MPGIKGASAREINQRMGRHGAVWQEESFDHVLRSSEGLDAKVGYILQNPVRKGLVNDWREYPWAWQRPDPDVAKMLIKRVIHPKTRSPGRIRPGQFYFPNLSSARFACGADECVRRYVDYFSYSSTPSVFSASTGR
jgi:hypothetical protein